MSTSRLSVEGSIGGSLAIAVAVYGIYNLALPTIADVRANPSHDDNLYAAERGATWATAGLVATISLLAKDPTIFVTGGVMVMAMAWWHRHSNTVEPALGGSLVPHPGTVAQQLGANADVTVGLQG